MNNAVCKLREDFISILITRRTRIVITSELCFHDKLTTHYSVSQVRQPKLPKQFRRFSLPRSIIVTDFPLQSREEWREEEWSSMG
jgi:hypothetical protein